MKRPVVVSKERIEWKAYELPDAPAEGQLRLRSLCSLISPGTELGLFRGEELPDSLTSGFGPDSPVLVGTGGDPSAKASPFPVLTGYNMVGEVIDVGPDVDPRRVGTRAFALARHTPLADLPAWETVEVPESLDTSTAAFAYLPTLGLASLRRLGFCAGQTVVVVGLGLVGGLALMLAEALGARSIGVEASAPRRKLWRGTLASSDVVAPNDATPDVWDVVIEASGSSGGLQLAFRLAADEGSIGVLGLHSQPLGPLFARDFYSKRLSVLSCRNDRHRPEGETGFTLLGNVRYMCGLLDRRVLDPSRIATQRFPAADIDQAFKLASADESAMTVLLDWS